MSNKSLLSIMLIIGLILVLTNYDNNAPETNESGAEQVQPNQTNLRQTERLTKAKEESNQPFLQAGAEVTPVEDAAEGMDSIDQKIANLLSEIKQLKDCHLTNSCPVDNSDPRASELLRGQMIKDKLAAYTELTLNNDEAVEETNALIQSLIDYPDGHVQAAVINLMSANAPNEENGEALIVALAQSYDAKIMDQAMTELIRYPQLAEQADNLFSQSLQTGSFYVAQEIAQRILPYLNQDNIELYEKIAQSLPPKSKRARALWSNINEYKKLSTGG